MLWNSLLFYLFIYLFILSVSHQSTSYFENMVVFSPKSNSIINLYMYECQLLSRSNIQRLWLKVFAFVKMVKLPTDVTRYFVPKMRIPIDKMFNRTVTSMGQNGNYKQADCIYLENHFSLAQF